MPLSTSLPVGIRAFAVIAIAVLSFFALQHGNVHQAATPDIVADSAGSAHHIDAHLAKKITIPFGHLTYNFSSPVLKEPAVHPKLVKRVPDLTYDDAVCRGRKLRDQIAAASTDGRDWSTADFAASGWDEYEGDEYEGDEYEGDVYEPTTDQAAALRKFGITTPPADIRHRDVATSGDFVNSQGETKTAEGVYDQLYDVQGNAIIAVSNVSPLSNLLKKRRPPQFPFTPEELTLELPPLHRWSDVTWAVWKDTAGDKVGSLQYLFRDNIITKATKYIMERVAGLPDATGKATGELHIPCCERRYAVNDPESDHGLALLGTPHGTGFARLQIDHPSQLGGRTSFVTMYTGVNDVSDDPSEPKTYYYLVYEMLIT